MANVKTSTETTAYAKIDTAPAATGFWTDEISPRTKAGVRKLWFSVRGTGSMTVTLQYRCAGDAGWTTYIPDNTIEPGVRWLMDDTGAGVTWRAGVAETGDYSSGECVFGFDW